MALKSIGLVTITTSGTPVRVSATRIGAQGFLIQGLSTNTGKIYVGSSAMVIATGVGVFAVIPAPTTGTLPSFSSTIVNAPAGFNLADIYIDADNSGEKVLISYTEQ